MSAHFLLQPCREKRDHFLLESSLKCRLLSHFIFELLLKVITVYSRRDKSDHVLLKVQLKVLTTSGEQQRLRTGARLSQNRGEETTEVRMARHSQSFKHDAVRID